MPVGRSRRAASSFHPSCQCWLHPTPASLGGAPRVTTQDTPGDPSGLGPRAAARLVGSPPPPLPRQQLIRFLGSHGTCRVVGKVLRRVLFPVPQERVDNGPLELHLVPARERVLHAPEGIEEKMFIRRMLGLAKIAIGKVQRNGPDLMLVAGHTGGEAQHDLLLVSRLQGQDVVVHPRHVIVAKQSQRGLAEHDDDLRVFLRQPLTGPQVERDVRPPPVIDLVKRNWKSPTRSSGDFTKSATIRYSSRTISNWRSSFNNEMSASIVR